MMYDILPDTIISAVIKDADGLDFGVVRLEIFLRNGKPRWQITRSMSIIDDTFPNDIDVNCQKTNDFAAELTCETENSVVKI